MIKRIKFVVVFLFEIKFFYNGFKQNSFHSKVIKREG